MSGAQSAKRAEAGANDQDQTELPIDDGFTDEERAAFEAMQQADTRVVEGDPGADGGEKPGDDPAGKKPEGAAADGAQQAAGADADDDEDEADPAQAAKPGADGKPAQQPRRVNFKKFERMENRAKAAETELASTRLNLARMDERIKLINEALTPKQQEEAQDDKDPPPDPEQDIFGYVKWQGRQIERLGGQLLEARQERQTETAEQEVVTGYVDDVRNFAAREPNFGPAYQFLMNSRIHELALYHYDKDLNAGEQLSAPELKRIKTDIEEEERQLAREAIKVGGSPAKRIYGLAKARGYKPQAAQQQQQQQDGKGEQQGKPNGKGAPGSLAEQAQKVSVTDEIANIKRGKASPSLSEGGGAPANPLTPERLANMSQDEFNEFMDGLSPSEQRRVMGG